MGTEFCLSRIHNALSLKTYDLGTRFEARSLCAWYCARKLTNSCSLILLRPESSIPEWKTSRQHSVQGSRANRIPQFWASSVRKCPPNGTLWLHQARFEYFFLQKTVGAVWIYLEYWRELIIAAVQLALKVDHP